VKVLRYLKWAPGCILLAAAIGLFAWTLQPSPVVSRKLSVQSVDLAYPPAEQAGQAGYHLTGPLTVSLVYPAHTQVGADVHVQMLVQSSPAGASPLEVQAKAQIELPGMVFSPDGPETAGFTSGSALRYDWHGKALKDGDFSGRVWLSFLLVDGANYTGPETAVSAQPISISASSLLGEGVDWVETAAIACLAAGSLAVCLAVFFSVKRRPNSINAKHVHD
jgi:hypothetical protein